MLEAVVHCEDHLARETEMSQDQGQLEVTGPSVKGDVRCEYYCMSFQTGKKHISMI